MERVLTGAAADTSISVVIAPVIQLIDEVMNLDQNGRLPQQKLRRMKLLLRLVTHQIEGEQGNKVDTIKQRLQRLQHSLDDAKHFVNRAQRQKNCLDSLLCKPRLSKEWTTNFNQLFASLQSDFSMFSDAQHREVLRPETAGFVGSGIGKAERQLNDWLSAPYHELRVISVFGMSGIGKTSLLKTVYKSSKEAHVFQVVIWITAFKKLSIMDLQSAIAYKSNLNLGGSSTVDQRKTMLSSFLKKVKFLLILDDLRSPFPLEEVGIPMDNDKGSKVVFSTPSIDVIQAIGANDSIKMEPLSPKEGWELFRRVAFKAGGAPTKNMEDVARQISKACEGLPLAINIVAATMAGNTSVNEWHLALFQMENSNSDFGFDGVNWAYDHLPDSKSKICFLYCGAFPEDEEIDVQTLLEMWIGEGLVPSLFRDVGHWYLKLLVDRCLFENVGKDMVSVKVHHVVRDTAISMIQKNNLFRITPEFPDYGMKDCKRIAVNFDKAPSLPTAVTCPELVTLILSSNRSLREVPNDFLLNLPSLRVVDLSHTNIESFPISMCQLTRVEFLKLSDTLIKDLPQGICNLSGLQFLHLDSCRELESLPSKIESLTNLKHLNLEACERLTRIPLGVSQLSSLINLQLIIGIDGVLNEENAGDGVCRLEDLTNFQNLMELSVVVKPGIKVDEKISGIKVGVMGTWLQMRKLTLKFNLLDLEVDEDDIVMEDLPHDLQSMRELQLFHIADYYGQGLPNSICHLQQLKKLELHGCYQLRDLPLLESLPNLRSLSLINCFKLQELRIGTRENEAGFPMLESLYLEGLPQLESMTNLSSNVAWDERTMAQLQVLTIIDCKSLKTLPMGIQKLQRFREVNAYEHWWKELIWKDNDAKMFLENKLKQFS